jgi:uncharacterized membrane protein YphA (DoxX/SURF4 family)
MPLHMLAEEPAAATTLGNTLLALSTLAARILLSATFIQAAVQKIRYRAQLPGVISNYRILPAALVQPASWLLPPLELAVGIALLVPTTTSAVAAACLLTLFTAAMLLNIARGRTHIDCGCFQSELRQSLGWDLIGRNGILLLIAAYSAVLPLRPPFLISALAILFGLVSYVLYQALNALSANRSALRSLAGR